MRLGSNECSKWKSMIKDAWNKATTAVQKIKDKDGNEYIPDGNGTVTIDYSPTTVNGYDERITSNGMRIQQEQTVRADADTALQNQITTNASDITATKTDIANLKTADATLQDNIDKKQDALTAGAGTVIIDDTIYATDNVKSIESCYYSPSTKNLTLYHIDKQIVSVLGDTPTDVVASSNLFKLGSGLKESTGSTSIVDTPTIDIDTSVIQTKLIAGNGINIADDGTISSQSSAPTADQVNLTDGRSVQTAVDAIEDEIGDESTAGSIKYVEKTNTDNIATNTSNISSLQTTVANLGTSIASKQDALTAGAGTVIIDDTIYATDNVKSIESCYYSPSTKNLTLYHTEKQIISVVGDTPTDVLASSNLFKLGSGLKESTGSTSIVDTPTIDIDTSIVQPLLTAGSGIGINDNTITNSGVRTAAATGITASGTAVPTSAMTGNRYSGITVNTNGTSTTIPLMYAYHQVSQQTSGTNSVPSTYSSVANLNGGLKIQWGEFYAYLNGTSYHKAVVNLRYSYANANTYVVIPVVHDYNANDLWSYQAVIEDKTTTSFEVHVSNGNSGTDISKDCKIMWVAIGF